MSLGQARGRASIDYHPHLLLITWSYKLKSHPEQDVIHFIIHGIEHGFPIGVDGSAQIVAVTRNMQPSAQNPEVIERYIQEEVSKGNMLGPFMSSMFQGLQINRFGTLPKKH